MAKTQTSKEAAHLKKMKENGYDPEVHDDNFTIETALDGTTTTYVEMSESANEWKRRPIYTNDEAAVEMLETLQNFIQAKETFEKDYGIDYPCTDPIQAAADRIRKKHRDMKKVTNDEALLNLFDINPARIRSRWMDLSKVWTEIPMQARACVNVEEGTIDEEAVEKMFLTYPMCREEAELHQLSSDFFEQFQIVRTKFAEHGHPHLWQHLIQDAMKGKEQFTWQTWSMWVRRPMREEMKKKTA